MHIRWKIWVLATITLMMLTGCGIRHLVRVGPDVSLLDVHATTHQLFAEGRFPIVLIFITNDCPISNAYAPEINNIVREYEPWGVRFYLVHVDEGLSNEEARQHAIDYGYGCAVLMDPQHRLVGEVGATVTPEAAVIGANRFVLYRGRIDNRYIDYGKKRLAPTQRDLREALDTALEGRAVSNPRTKAIGCFIPEA